jgi:hypothetical protein
MPGEPEVFPLAVAGVAAAALVGIPGQGATGVNLPTALVKMALVVAVAAGQHMQVLLLIILQQVAAAVLTCLAKARTALAVL